MYFYFDKLININQFYKEKVFTLNFTQQTCTIHGTASLLQLEYIL